jgi:hypothetical protein
MVVLRPVLNFGLLQKRVRQPVARMCESVNCLGVKSIAYDEKAVLVESLSLLIFELTKIQYLSLP